MTSKWKKSSLLVYNMHYWTVLRPKEPLNAMLLKQYDQAASHTNETPNEYPMRPQYEKSQEDSDNDNKNLNLLKERCS